MKSYLFEYYAHISYIRPHFLSPCLTTAKIEIYSALQFFCFVQFCFQEFSFDFLNKFFACFFIIIFLKYTLV